MTLIIINIFKKYIYVIRFESQKNKVRIFFLNDVQMIKVRNTFKEASAYKKLYIFFYAYNVNLPERF